MPGLPPLPAGGLSNWTLLVRALVRVPEGAAADRSRPGGGARAATDTVELRGRRWMPPLERSVEGEPRGGDGSRPGGGDGANGGGTRPAAGREMPAREAAVRAWLANREASGAWFGHARLLAREETAVREFRRAAGTEAAAAKPPGSVRPEPGPGGWLHPSYAPSTARGWLALTRRQRELAGQRRAGMAERSGSLPPSGYPVSRTLRAIEMVWRRWPLLGMFGLWFTIGLVAGVGSPEFLPAWGVGFLGLVAAGFLASSLRSVR